MYVRISFSSVRWLKLHFASKIIPISPISARSLRCIHKRLPLERIYNLRTQSMKCITKPKTHQSTKTTGGGGNTDAIIFEQCKAEKDAHEDQHQKHRQLGSQSTSDHRSKGTTKEITDKILHHNTRN